jgi:hypothetical protein
MHPKSAIDVHVTDAEVDEARSAASWFLETILQIQTRALKRAQQRGEVEETGSTA